MKRKLTKIIGMRTIKTGLSVFISVAICILLQRENPTMAVLAAVFSMRADNIETIRSGLSRTFGNMTGALLALICIYFYAFLPNDVIGQLLLLPLGSMLIIIICVETNNQAVIVPATATFVTIFIFSRQEPDFVYAFQRVIDTLIGSIVSLIVNKFVCPNVVELVE